MSKFSLRKRTAAILAATAIGAGGLTVAALTAPGANAATTSTAVVATTHSAHKVVLVGSNVLELTFNGSTFVYKVHFVAVPIAPGVWLITGTLKDKYEPVPITLPLDGVQIGKTVIFSVSYPTTGVDAGDQGVRTFVGTFDHHEINDGTWSETGTEGGGSGESWDLQFPVFSFI
jgi:hypothetical protein